MVKKWVKNNVLPKSYDETSIYNYRNLGKSQNTINRGTQMPNLLELDLRITVGSY